MTHMTFSEWLGDLSYGPPFGVFRGVLAQLAYPVAESREQRLVRPKLGELRAHYRLPAAERQRLARARLGEMLAFAGVNVPYYRDLFASTGFDPSQAAADPRRLEMLPLLNKDVINEQGERLLSRPLAGTRHYPCKTGGSTGRKATIWYDQEAADYASAAVNHTRERIGANRWRTSLHFAARLPDTPVERWPNRETFKGIAMNRSNIFFAELSAEALDEIWETVLRRRPYLLHAHPSTIYALACHVRDHGEGPRRAFAVFESSGELLEDYQRKTIAEVFGCRVVDRYGLAELGVVAYQFGDGPELEVLESEAWLETVDGQLVGTGLRNRLMPLIRYETGDLGTLESSGPVMRLTALTGRLHDMIAVNGVPHLTHHLQDVLDNRVAGVQEFQFDLRSTPPVLRIVPEAGIDAGDLRQRIEHYWPGAFAVEIVAPDGMVRVGDRAKFRHVVTA